MDSKEKEEFNGYNFGDKKTRRKMKFLVITRGDLDLNGAYAFKSKRALRSYLKEGYGREVEAIFEAKDLTDKF